MEGGGGGKREGGEESGERSEKGEREGRAKDTAPSSIKVFKGGCYR